MTACQVCRLPPRIRHEVEDRVLRLRAPLRRVVEYADAQGARINKDSLSRHCRYCLGSVQPVGPTQPALPPDQLVALAAADLLKGWPTFTVRFVERLHRDGLHDAAAVARFHLDDSYEAAINAAEGTALTELINCRTLMITVGQLLRRRSPDVSEAIAAALRDRGAEELAADFVWLAEQAAQVDATPQITETLCPSTT